MSTQAGQQAKGQLEIKLDLLEEVDVRATSDSIEALLRTVLAGIGGKPPPPFQVASIRFYTSRMCRCRCGCCCD